MLHSHANRILALAVLALLGTLSATALADQNRVRLEAVLSGSATDPDAEGQARFESRPDRVQLRVEVEEVSVTDAVEVHVNGNLIATLSLTDGAGELELNSRNGDKVPVLKAGDEIEVIDAADGVTLLLVGTLQAH